MVINFRSYLPCGVVSTQEYNLERCIVLTRRKAMREYMRNGKTAAFTHHMEWLAWAIKARQFG